MSTPLKNRDEIKALILALTAIHTEAAYKDTLSEQIVDNLVFRKEVTGTQGGSGAINVDFDGKDYVELTLAGNSTITFLNVNLGENKVLKIVKSAGQTVAFSGALDQTPDADNVTALTSVYYLVYKKDTGANIIVEPVSKTFGAASETAKGIIELATLVEVQAGTDTERAVTPDTLKDAYFVDTGWLVLIPNTNVTMSYGVARQRGGWVTITGIVSINSSVPTGSYKLFDLPSGISGPIIPGGTWIDVTFSNSTVAVIGGAYAVSGRVTASDTITINDAASMDDDRDYVFSVSYLV